MLFVMAALLVGQRFSGWGWENFCKDSINGTCPPCSPPLMYPTWLRSQVALKLLLYPKQNQAATCPIAVWDVSQIKSTAQLFMDGTYNTGFNADLSGWDVSKNENMACMFRESGRFNSTLGRWDTSKVASMEGTFQKASVFNSDVSRWCV